MKTFVAALLLCALLTGCAMNRAHFVEDLYDPVTGARTAHTTYDGAQAVTAGSKLPEGSTQLTYRGQGKTPWNLEVGGSVKGMEAAGDPGAVLQSMTALVESIGRIVVGLQPGKVASEEAKRDAETERLQILMSGVGRENRNAGDSATGATK